MRRWFPFLFLCGLAVLALRPLWWHAAPYLFLDDGYLHLFRVFEFDRVLREGVAYPRWAPDLAFGYGYPIFNFYPPLAYYLTETLHLLGFSIPTAVQAAFAVIVCVGLAGAYRLGADLSSDDENEMPEPGRQLAGILTACAYVFFPYFLLDMYTRGAIAESLAAAILPWLVWSFRRALTQPRLAETCLAALFSAGLVLSHNLTALFSAPFLVLYVLWECYHLPASKRVNGMLALGGAVLLGAALAAVYWLPLIAEMPLVNVSREAKQLAVIVQYSILSLRDVLQFSIPYQYHEAPFPLALIPTFLAAMSLLSALVFRRLPARRLVVFFGIVALLATLLLTEVTLAIWHSIPVMLTLQFPWRLSVLIGLCAAVLIGILPGAAAQWRETLGPLPTRHLFSAGIAALLIWVGLANLAPQRLNYPRDKITLGQLARFEVNSRNIGLGTMDEYLPLTVKYLPRQLESKFDVPATTQISLEQYSTVRRAMTVTASERVALSLHSFYFPDWRATIDGQPATATPSTAMGLLTVDVPAGEHRVVFESVDTAPRQIGVFLSTFGLVVLIALIALVAARENSRALVPALVALALLSPFAIPTALAVFSSPAPLLPTTVDVSPGLDLIGVRIEDAQLASDVWRIDGAPDVLNIQVFWQVKQQLRDAPFAWQLVDDAGHAWSRREQLPRYSAGFAGTWVPNEVVPDYYDLPLTPGMPPGRYVLQMSVRDKLLPVGIIELTGGSAPARPMLKIEQRVEAQVGDRIRLLGYNAPAIAQPGTSLPVTLFWQATRDLPEDYTVFVHLLDGDQRLVAQNDGLTHNGFLPTTLWSVGAVISDERAIDLPDDLQPGLYHLVAGLYRFDDLARLPVTSTTGPSPDDQIALGSIKVPMQARSSPDHLLNVSFGESIRLAGFDLISRDASGSVLRRSDSKSPSRLAMTPGQTMSLTLHWQAVAPVGTDYTVFVHVVDEGGNVVAQQDQMPGQNRYPTRIWEAGEMVLDEYSLPLDLPPGKYNIAAGMYSPQSGERLNALAQRGEPLPGRQVILAQIEMTAQ